jgi:hypothetical protein
MMLCIYNLHHNYAGRAGPPRAWPSAADRAAAGLAGSRWPGLWPARPPAGSCCRRMRWGLWSQPRRVLTGTPGPSARQACLPGEEGGGVTPTIIRSLTFHGIHWPQGARRNTRGRTAAAVRASRNGSRGAVHVARGAIHCA